MEDVTFYLDQINELEAMDMWERDKKYPGVNMLGYSKWGLYQEINDFIIRQMEKHGLNVEAH